MVGKDRVIGDLDVPLVLILQFGCPIFAQIEDSYIAFHPDVKRRLHQQKKESVGCHAPKFAGPQPKVPEPDIIIVRI